MLLKKYLVLFIFLLALPTFADEWSIVKENKSYFLKSGENKFELVYNGTPKILNIEDKNGLSIIDYFSGEYGTTQKSLITRRLVISKKTHTKVADDILKAKFGKEIIESKWDFDFSNHLIKVYDPDLDLTKRYNY